MTTLIGSAAEPMAPPACRSIDTPLICTLASAVVIEPPATIFVSPVSLASEPSINTLLLGELIVIPAAAAPAKSMLTGRSASID